MMQDALPRTIFSETHELFRDQVRRFFERDVVPFHAQWDEDGIVPREIWAKAGETGILCPTVAEEDGGVGGDFLYSAVVIEEQSRVWASGPGFFIHSEMAAPYISNFGSKEQKEHWLPKLVAGEAIIGVAMSEPDAGSDLKGMKTRAEKRGDTFILKGQKVFISNGQLGDVFIVAAKTGSDRDADAISLFLVDASLPGFRRGTNLKKMGAHAQDTSELFFDDIELPASSLLGSTVGQGFKQLMHGLSRERLAISISCVAKAEGALEQTLEYAAARKLFGRKLVDYQNTQFRLAEVQTDIVVGRAMVDHLLALHMEDKLDATAAAAAKLWTTEMVGRVVDTCLQLYGGWGYMTEYPIARAYTDARAERIAGGTSEVMKSIISKSLFRKNGIEADFS